MKKLICALLWGLSFVLILPVNTGADIGDINDDGSVDMADAILGLQVLAGMKPADIFMTADVNNDGKIGLTEVIYLLRLITVVEPLYFAYIPNVWDGNVSVIDTSTNTVIDTVDVPGTYIRGTVAACILSTQVYVVGDNISMIDTLTNTVTENIPPEVLYPAHPYLLALNPAGTYLYTPQTATDGDRTWEELVVIDTATNTVVTSIDGITKDPDSDSTDIIDVVVGPMGDYIYVSGSDATLVSTNPYQYEYASFIAVIDTDTNSVISEFAIEWSARRMAVHPSGDFLYVLYLNLDIQEHLMAVINTSTYQIVENVDLQQKPVQYLAVHPDGTKIYGSQPSVLSPNWNPGEVVVINTSNYAIATSIEVGIQPNALSVHPSGTRLYVVNEIPNQDNGSVSVIDTTSNTVIDTLQMGRRPKALSHQFIAKGN